MPSPRLAALAVLPVFLLALASVPAARAASAYTIEIIVFAHPGGDARYSETWRPEPGTPDVSRAFPVSAGNGVSPVGPSAYRMHGIWQALRASSAYRPLRHLAWIQAGTSRDRAPVVLVGEDAGAPVYGTVRVSRGRFLHVDVDLVYRDGDGPVRFVSHRRMKSNEIHYLDHPLFGVLVVATPISG